mmetsp:Transcript_3863/g.12227  ORF Transcript_3863/g.12227 Transcript_3863/m.12227 type:complete len:203 (-) Transcript_3863:1107-1715(-)
MDLRAAGRRRPDRPRRRRRRPVGAPRAAAARRLQVPAPHRPLARLRAAVQRVTEAAPVLRRSVREAVRDGHGQDVHLRLPIPRRHRVPVRAVRRPRQDDAWRVHGDHGGDGVPHAAGDGHARHRRLRRRVPRQRLLLPRDQRRHAVPHVRRALPVRLPHVLGAAQQPLLPRPRGGAHRADQHRHRHAADALHRAVDAAPHPV